MKIVALAGGVGGAKLVDGLAQVMRPQDLNIIVNTADDFEHLGLTICPDLDTITYTLAGIANPDTGWGQREETWHALETINLLGGPTWFHLGDRDLGTHLERTRLLRNGVPLNEISKIFCRAWGVKPGILPMSDDPIRTIVDTVEAGKLEFQEYFVRRQCQPRIKGFHFEGCENARPAPGILDVIHQADHVIFCPSNPWVSLAPILAVPGIKTAILQKKVTGVSPIIGGKSIKGPAAKMFSELGIIPSARAVAEHFADLLDCFIIDTTDGQQKPEIEQLGIRVFTTNILMQTAQDRLRLAQDMLHFMGIQKRET